MTVHPTQRAFAEPTFWGSGANQRSLSSTPAPTSPPIAPNPNNTTASEVGAILAKTAVNDRQAMLALIIRFLGESELDVAVHLDLRA